MGAGAKVFIILNLCHYFFFLFCSGKINKNNCLAIGKGRVYFEDSNFWPAVLAFSYQGEVLLGRQGSFR